MTFNDYINNPMGKKNAVFTQREMFRSMYADKLDKILVRENGKIDFKTYVDKKNDKYYVYIKIPSEVIAKFYYDVVIEFSTTNAVLKGIQTLDEYDVRFFSNDPAFVFTFAHAFIKNDMFIKELTPKMSKLAVKKVAEEKNPKDEIGYVKSIFFAFLYMRTRGLFKKIAYLDAPTIDFKILTPLIMHADKKIELRQEAGKEYQRKLSEKKNLKQNRAKPEESIASDVQKKQSVVPVDAVKTTKKINKVKAANTASFIKHTKKKR